jgi:hypothetical protein
MLVTALRSGATVRRGGDERPLTVSQFLEVQREERMATMRELTHARRAAGAHDRLALDYEIFHIEADLRWLEHAEASLDIVSCDSVQYE